MSAEDVVVVGRRRLTISHAGRLVFPEVGVTKLDLVRHYAAVGPLMVAHLRGHPLALQNFPQGVGEAGYFLKNAPAHFPSWVGTVEVPKREGGVVRHVVADEPATLVYLAGQNTVTVHMWTSRADRLERPDRLVVDFDPSGEHFGEVRAAAQDAGALLREVGLEPFAMTTGSRGVHVVAPLRRTADYDVVHRFARDVADVLVRRDPQRLTTEFRRERRGGRIYVDVGRNAYGQHAVAPYAVRALPRAPVATPLRWEELDDDLLTAQRWTLATIGERLAESGDPWRSMESAARGVGRARRLLVSL